MSNGFGSGFPGLAMILVWVVVIALAVWLARAFVGTSRGAGQSQGKSARQILDDRYARGEIEQKRKDLSD